jgi:Domain of unknown function (DUF6379)
MYDKYLIVGEAFRNVEKDGQLTGFQLGLRLPYYRGVVLSLVGETVLAVDGEKVPAEKMTVTVGGKTFPMTRLEDEPAAKWEFGEVGIVTVEKPGGLQPGEHTVELQQHMKISYVPGGFWGKDQKTLSLTG